MPRIASYFRILLFIGFGFFLCLNGYAENSDNSCKDDSSCEESIEAETTNSKVETEIANSQEADSSAKQISSQSSSAGVGVGPASKIRNLAPTGVSAELNVSASPTGSSSVSIPIIVPPGRRGVQPQLALTYSSGSGNGMFGIGWNLNINYIRRSLKYGVPKYDDTDIFEFSLNGTQGELVKIGDLEDGSSEYRLKNESAFLKIIKHKGYWWNPNYWEVWDKGGNNYYFDNIQYSSQENFCWYLSIATDTNNNYINFSYIEDQNQVYPYIIEYTANEDTQPKNSVTFILQDRQDVISNYKAGLGSPMIASKLIGNIEIKTNDELVRKYQFTYKNSDAGLSLLDKVTMIGNDGTTSLDLGKFTYQVNQLGDSGWGSPSLIWTLPVELVYYKNNSSYDRGTRLADINRDGLIDVLISRKSDSGTEAKTVWLNTKKGWKKSESWTKSLPVNFVSRRGDNSSDQGVRLVEINGDGLIDILRGIAIMFPSGEIVKYQEVWLNNGDGWSVGPSQWKPPLTFTFSLLDASTTADMGVRFADVNGDSLTDILYYINNSAGTTKGAWLNTGNGWEETSNIWTPPIDFINNACDVGTRLVDFNGDGLVDIIRALKKSIGEEEYKAWINNGNGWTDVSETWKPPINFVYNTVIYPYPNTPLTSYDEGVRLVDVNSDGLTDIVQYKNPGEIKGAWLNTGNGWKQVDANKWVPPVDFVYKPEGKNYTYDRGVSLADVNGDGLDDVVQYRKEESSDVKSTWLNPGPNPNLLDTAANSLGGKLDINYKASTQYDNTGEDDLSDLSLSLQTVTSISTNDGIGNTFTTTYEYKGGLYDFEEREFRGFNLITQKDPEGNTADSYFYQDDIHKGKVYWQGKKKDSTLLQTIDNFWDYLSPYSGVSFSYLDEQKIKTYDGADYTYTGINYDYDDYGNIIRQLSLGDVEKSGDEIDTHIDYIYDTTNWKLSFPYHTYTNDSSGKALRQKWLYYDNLDLGQINKGNLTKEELWLEGSVNPEIKYAYDEYGNQTSTTDANGKTSSITYETTYQTFPYLLTNAKGHQTTTIYDPKTRQILSVTDSNGNTTTNVYDALGRLSKTYGPKDTSPDYPKTNNEYRLGQVPNRVIVSQREKTNTSDVFVSQGLFDGFGKSIQAKSESEQSDKEIISNTVIYDSLGRVKTKYLPFFSSILEGYVTPPQGYPYISYSYDALGRIKKITYPDNTTTTYTYYGYKTKITDALNNYTYTTRDAYGKTINDSAYNDGDEYTTTYEYNAVGDLLKITDDNGNVISTVYDTLGREISSNDPDTGVRDSIYDGIGNLIQFTDAKGQVIRYYYDELNRIAEKMAITAPVVSVFTDKAIYYKNETIKITVRVQNPSQTEPMVLYFFDGKEAGYEIDDLVEEVYSNGSYSVLPLEPGQTKDWVFNFNDTNDLLDFGQHTITGFVAGYGKSSTTITLALPDYNQVLNDSWQHYKAYKISSQGQAWADEDNSNDTVVSEGQAYAMFKAVFMYDQTAFNLVWNWTQQNLQRKNLAWGDTNLIDDFNNGGVWNVYGPMSTSSIDGGYENTKAMKVNWTTGYSGCLKTLNKNLSAEGTGISFYLKGDPVDSTTNIRLTLEDADGEQWIWQKNGYNYFTPPDLNNWIFIQAPLSEFIYRPDWNAPNNYIFDRYDIKEILFEAYDGTGIFYVDEIYIYGGNPEDVNKDNLFAFKWTVSEGTEGEDTWRDSASDADCDIALALILADKLVDNGIWSVPNKNYADEAKLILNDIWEKEVRYLDSTGKYYMSAGDKFKYMSGSDNAVGINPSYLAPYSYRIFEEFDSESLTNGGNHNWAYDSNSAAYSSLEVMGECGSHDFGSGQSAAGPSYKRLPSDWIQLESDGQINPNDWFLEQYHFDVPTWDAFRGLWRVAVDYYENKNSEARDYLLGVNGPIELLKTELANNGNISSEYYHNGERYPYGSPSSATYGAYLGFIASANLAAEGAYQTQVDQILELLMSDYNPAGYWGSNEYSYYTQNWAWLGLALYAEKIKP